MEHASAVSGVTLRDGESFQLLKSPVLVLRVSVDKVRVGNGVVLALWHKAERKRGL